MKGLLIKDFLIMKNYLKFYSFLFVAYLAISIVTKNIYFMMGVTMTMLSYYVVSSFSFDEAAKWDAFARALPVKRRQAVLAKYIFAGCMMAVSITISIAGAVFYQVFHKVDTMELVVFIATMCAIGMLYLEIQIPLVYKTGVEKTRIFLLFFFVIIFSCLMLLIQMGGSLPAEEQMLLGAVGFLTAIVIGVFISYFLSCRIYEKKEF